MFMLLPTVAVYGMAAMAMMARGRGRGGRGGRGGQAPAPAPQYINGEICSWTAATEQQTELIKQLLENGQLDGMDPSEIRIAFPLFASSAPPACRTKSVV